MHAQNLFIVEHMYIAIGMNVVVYWNVFAVLWQETYVTAHVKSVNEVDWKGKGQAVMFLKPCAMISNITPHILSGSRAQKCLILFVLFVN